LFRFGTDDLLKAVITMKKIQAADNSHYTAWLIRLWKQRLWLFQARLLSLFQHKKCDEPSLNNKFLAVMKQLPTQGSL